MKKLKLGIDIDNVICDTYNVYLQTFNQYFGLSIEYYQLFDFYYLEKHSGVSYEKVMNFLDNVLHQKEYQISLPPYPKSKKIVESWQKSGHQLHYISARPLFTYEATNLWLKKHGFHYQHSSLHLNSKMGIYPTDTDFKKGLAQKYKLHIFVEDIVEIANELPIPVLLINRPWNKNKQIKSHVKRVDNWVQINTHIKNYEKK